MERDEIKNKAAEVFQALDGQTEGDGGADYKAMYYRLYNKITDTINDLIAIQQETERMFIER